MQFRICILLVILCIISHLRLINSVSVTSATAESGASNIWKNKNLFVSYFPSIATVNASSYVYLNDTYQFKPGLFCYDQDYIVSLELRNGFQISDYLLRITAYTIYNAKNRVDIKVNPGFIPSNQTSLVNNSYDVGEIKTIVLLDSPNTTTINYYSVASTGYEATNATLKFNKTVKFALKLDSSSDIISISYEYQINPFGLFYLHDNDVLVSNKIDSITRAEKYYKIDLTKFKQTPCNSEKQTKLSILIIILLLLLLLLL